MKKGKLIVMEGSVDGIGKTKQTELLVEKLKKEGYEVVTHHFPTYGTYHGASVEKYLKGEYDSPDTLSPYYVNSLYAVDRAVIWYTKLKELYEKGNIIILDRYTTSSLIYQSAFIKEEKNKKEFIEYVQDFEYNKIGIKKPDAVIFLTAPFDLVTDLRLKRKNNEGVSNDIHEKDLSFLRNVSESALFVSKYLSWDKVECSEKNNIRSISDIHEEVYKLVKSKIK